MTRTSLSPFDPTGEKTVDFSEQQERNFPAKYGAGGVKYEGRP